MRLLGRPSECMSREGAIVLHRTEPLRTSTAERQSVCAADRQKQNSTDLQTPTRGLV